MNKYSISRLFTIRAPYTILKVIVEYISPGIILNEMNNRFNCRKLCELKSDAIKQFSLRYTITSF